MDITSVTTIISTLGFPIAACTEAINKLCDKLDDVRG